MKNRSSSESRATRGVKRATVLAEAALSLNRLGVSQTSLADIARRVGVSRAALYYYFEDQQDLVFQCYRNSCILFAGRLQEAIDGGGDALTILDAFVDGVQQEDQVEFAALSELAYLRPEQRAVILELHDKVVADLCGVLRRGSERGELRSCEEGVVAQTILGVISWVPLTHRWRTRESLSDAEMLAATKDLLRYGLAAVRSAPANYRPLDLTPPAVPGFRV